MVLSFFRQDKTVRFLEEMPEGSVMLEKKRGLRVVRWRLDPLTHHLRVTIPYHTTQAYLNKITPDILAWHAKAKAARSAIPLSAPSVINVGGVEKQLIHNASGRTGVLECDDTIVITGHVDDQERLMKKWLKEKITVHLTDLSHGYAMRVDRKVARISVRETSSRWGSCTSQGNVSYSWRLAFAPIDVVHYIVAHEVAHLVHLNHSPDFWSVVAYLMPDYGPSRQWLKRNGWQLFRYGTKAF